MMMKTPIGLVTVALAAATLLAGSFLLVTGTRGQNSSFESSAGQLEVQTVATGLVHPWALAFLPDGPVKEGETWERSTESNLGSGQVMSFRTKYEYKGTIEQDGRKLDKIEGKAFEVSLVINGNPMLQLTKSDLKIKESASTILFDREKGHVVSRVSKVRIDGPLTLTINGMELPGKVDLTMQDKGTRQK